MSEPIALRIKRALIEDARSDVVGLWTLLRLAKQEVPTTTPQGARTATLTAIAEALSDGAVVAGGFTAQDEATVIFVPWPLRVDEAVARIQREWDALGREPDLGEIVWFVDPRILPVSANKHPMGKGWQPDPA